MVFLSILEFSCKYMCYLSQLSLLYHRDNDRKHNFIAFLVVCTARNHPKPALVVRATRVDPSCSDVVARPSCATFAFICGLQCPSRADSCVVTQFRSATIAFVFKYVCPAFNKNKFTFLLFLDFLLHHFTTFILFQNS